MPVSDDMLRWTAVVKGQPDTCWEGGVFHFAIEFPQGYPFKPLKLWLETKMYHPNVSVQTPDHTTIDGGGGGGGAGASCISGDVPQTNFASGMLRRWSPAHTVRKGAFREPLSIQTHIATQALC
jgi:ubiquitin-protein ligase